MKLGKIYELFVKEGIKEDPRTQAQVRQWLAQQKKDFNKLRASEKKFFDSELLTNPYSDTRLLNGDSELTVKRMMVGIDIGVGELLVADRLSEKGKIVDVICAHHPEGIAYAGLDEVMDMQADMLTARGIDNAFAKSSMDNRVKEVRRSLHGKNHTQVVDAAKLLDVPLMCCHTPADNHVARYLQNLVNQKKPKTLQSIVDLLHKEPEYQDASKTKAGPRIIAGKPSNKAGKIVVDMTGGTEGAKNIYGRLAQLGVDTILGMHMSSTHYKRAREEHLNVVIAGHMASDNLGMNLLIDKLVRRSNVDIIECSGFRRVKRRGVHT